jgi:hypothetical protein
MDREREDAPGPFNFRGCDLTAECLPATEGVRLQLPATAPSFAKATPWQTNSSTGWASARGRVSKTQLTPGGTEAACHFPGSWQTSNALALQASLYGSVTHRLHHFYGQADIEPRLVSRFSFACTHSPLSTSRQVNQPLFTAPVSIHSAKPRLRISPDR